MTTGKSDKIKIGAVPIYQAAAPPFFIIAASLRCFLETRVFSAFDDFSYYTLLHHVLWYVTAISAVLVFLSIYLKLNPRRLLWLYYGGVIIFIPVLYSALTHTPMKLEYFSGTIPEIIRYSLSAGWAFERNRPQFFAILTLDIGIFITGFLYSRSLKKAAFALMGVHLILTLIGTRWFSDKNGPGTIIFIRTAFPGHGFMALIWLQTASFLTLALVWQEKRALFSENRMIWKVLSGFFAWMLMAVFFFSIGKFDRGFDAVTATSAIWTVAILWAFARKTKGDLKRSPFIIAIFLSILLVQLLATVPLYFPGHFNFSPKKIVVPIFYSNWNPDSSPDLSAYS